MKKSNKIFLYSLVTLFSVITIAAISFRLFSPPTVLNDAEIEFFSKNVVVGNGQIIKKSLAIDDFNKLTTNGKFEINLDSNLPNHTIDMVADANIVPHVNISAVHQELLIKADANLSNAPKININNKDIQAITLNGKTIFKANHFNADNLVMTLQGHSNAELQGNIKVLEIKLNGNSELHATIADANHIAVVVNGNGSLYLSGKTKNLTLTTHGKSYIDAKNLLSDTVIIQSTGQSQISTHAIKSLTVQSFGKSEIEYEGDPIITKNTLGNSTLKKI